MSQLASNPLSRSAVSAFTKQGALPAISTTGNVYTVVETQSRQKCIELLDMTSNIREQLKIQRMWLPSLPLTGESERHFPLGIFPFGTVVLKSTRKNVLKPVQQT